ncbi:hypothetical protein A8B75_18910 [Sphingomonadales bacterium EhC05]|nr:hypothetical protein A8B75_18910 [Sphingomonadales bacterium EhC05]
MSSTKSKPQTKSSKVITMLSRTKGATFVEICNATNWQKHSVRAFLTGVRKKGFEVAREQRSDDGTAYRIIQNPINKDGKGAT